MPPTLTAAEPSSERPIDRRRIAADANKLSRDDHAAHDWYRFVLSYPPHLVRDYLKRLPAPEGRRVLDPFCGTGTTVVECKKLGVSSVGVEAHPFSHFASTTKIDWQVDPAELEDSTRRVAAAALRELEIDGIVDGPSPALIAEMPAPIPVHLERLI
jgi:SAM-dependent methyltransferase